MSRNFERWQPAFNAALQSVCDTVDAELEVKDEEIHSLRAQVEHFTKANQILSSRLEGLHKTQLCATLIDDERLPNADPDNAPLQRQEHQERTPLRELSKNHSLRTLEHLPSATKHNIHKLRRQYGAVKRDRDQAVELARKFKAERDKWMQYAATLESKGTNFIAKDLKRGRSADIVLKERDKLSNSTVHDALRSVHRLVSDTSGTFCSEPGLKTHPRSVKHTARNVDMPSRHQSIPRCTRQSKDEALANLSSTECDASSGQDDQEFPGSSQLKTAEGRVSLLEKSSSDEPTFLFEQAVDRKRKRVENGSTAPRRIESENGSSEPVLTGEPTHVFLHESIHLDFDGDGIPTPKRNRRKVTQLNQAEAELPEHTATSPRAERVTESYGRPMSNTVAETSRNTLASPKLDRKEVSLQYAPENHRKRMPHKLGRALGEIAEIEAEDAMVHMPSRTPSMMSSDRSSKRIESLLAASSSKSGTVLLSAKSRRQRARSVSAGNDATSSVGLYQAEKDRIACPTDSHTTAARPLRLPLAKSAMKGSIPLRRRPLSALKLSDFKITPKFNDGQCFAFNEVVRNKADRAQLEACTDPQCCGKVFHIMAQSERDAAGPTVLYRKADVEMLEDYLGDEAYRLGTMTHAEREDSWFKAKIQSLANKLGRHRHHVHSRPSPPGFWDTDFPTTQEVAKEREEGEKIERRMVEERRREAMRRGGRWLFKDE